MNTGYMDASVDMTTEEMNIDINIQELNAETTVSEMNVNIETQELDADMEVEQVIVNLDTSSSIEVDMFSEYGIRDNKEKDINFYDYDGTLLYSYYADQFLNSASMPPLPSQHELICQGWNWDYETLKTHVRKLNKADVGAIYTTYDGKSRIYFSIADRLNINTVLAIKGTAIIDWGDGTSDEITGTVEGEQPTDAELITLTHTYPENGSYTITFDNGNDLLYIATLMSNSVMDGGTTSYARAAHNYHVTKVNLGNNIYILPAGIAYLYDLEKISFSNTCYTNEYKVDEYRSLNAFANNKNLKYIGFPRSFKLVPSVAYCDLLKRISIPDSMERYDAAVFQNCTSLERIVLPITINDYFTGYFFNNCTNLVEIIYNYDNPNIDTLPTYFCAGCSNLKTFKIGKYITDIEDRAFNACTALKDITIEGNINSINSATFQDCISLTKVKIKNMSETTMELWYYMFENDYTLKYIDLSEVTQVPIIKSGTFYPSYMANDFEIIVPDALYNDWISATNWSNLAEHIVKASEV